MSAMPSLIEHSVAAEFCPDIEIVEVHYLGGPNRWTYRPVLEAVVDIGMLEDFPSNLIPGFTARLTAWLPGLVEHRCSHGVRGGFLRRLDEGTWPAHILEHVSLELQTLAGVPTGFGRARETTRRGVYRVIIRAFEEKTARLTLVEARALVLAAMTGRPFDREAAVARLRASFAQHGPGAAATAVMLAAERQRIPYLRRNGDDLVQLGYGARQRRIRSAQTDATSAIAEGIAQDEDLARELLRACGVPLVDPDITANASVDDLSTSHYRLLVVGSQVVSATRFAGMPGAPQGQDGPTQSIVGASMEESRHAADSVARLPSGAIVPVERVHPDILAGAVLAARVIGLDIAAVDLLADDALQTGHHAIIDVRANPDFASTLRAAADAAQPTGDAILAGLFAGPADARIPVIGVAGTSSTTPVARNIAWLLRESAPDDGALRASAAQLDGRRIGLTSSEGIFLNERRIADASGGPHESAVRLLANPLADVAIIENGLETMVTQGLAYDRCSVGVVTSLADDARVDEFDVVTRDQVRTVLRSQVDVILPTGVAVLNADDEQIATLAALCDGETMFYADSAAGAERIVEHLAAGGRAVRVENDCIVLRSGTDATTLITLQALDAQSASAWLPAVAAAWAAGATPVQLAARLAGLSSAKVDAPVAEGRASVASVV